MFAGHGMPCPYERAKSRAHTARERQNARNSAPFLRQGKRNDRAVRRRACLYEADDGQVAKYVCRARHAVPLLMRDGKDRQRYKNAVLTEIRR